MESAFSKVSGRYCKWQWEHSHDIFRENSEKVPYEILRNIPKYCSRIIVRRIFLEHSHDTFPEYSEKAPYEIPGSIRK